MNLELTQDTPKPPGLRLRRAISSIANRNIKFAFAFVAVPKLEDAEPFVWSNGTRWQPLTVTHWTQELHGAEFRFALFMRRSSALLLAEGGPNDGALFDGGALITAAFLKCWRRRTIESGTLTFKDRMQRHIQDFGVVLR